MTPPNPKIEETPETDAWCELAVNADVSACLGLAKCFEKRLSIANAKAGKLEEERQKWEVGCRANAADALDCHEKADKQRLELIAFRKVSGEMEEALKRCKVCVDFAAEEEVQEEGGPCIANQAFLANQLIELSLAAYDALTNANELKMKE